MQTDLATRARAIAASLRALPASARARELEQLCGNEPELMQAVRGRLRALELQGDPQTPQTTNTEPTDPHQTLTSPRSSAGPAARGLPEQLGRFRVIRELGRGGMGVVYEAEQELPRRRVALKTLPLDHYRDAGERFRVEVDATARVIHPGVPQVFEVFEVEGVPVLVMEFVDGQPLDAAARLLDQAQRVRLLRDVALAVHAVHERGVLHRDLKPSNILVTATGQPKVLDFGVASLGIERAGGSRLACTLSYAAPEQLAGDPEDLRCDVYGLGALCLHLLCDRLVVPPRGLSLAELIKRKRAALEPPPELPSALAAILACALAPDPDQRYPSAEALADDLNRYLAWRPVHAFEGATNDEDDFALTCTALETGGWSLVRRSRASGQSLGSLSVQPLLQPAEHQLGLEIPEDLRPHTRLIEALRLGKSARGSRTWAALFSVMFERALDEGALLSLIAATPTHYPELSQLGFRPAGRVRAAPELGHVLPMALVHDDLDHLVALGSPLAAVLRGRGRFGDAARLERVRALVHTKLAVSHATSHTTSHEALDSPVFAGLSSQARSEIVDGARLRPGNPGDVLICAGEVGRWMAIVDTGLVEILVDGHVIAVRGPGEVIGEMGFLLDKPRTAEVVVAAPATTLLVIEPATIAKLSRDSDREQLWRNLAIALARKLETQTQRSLGTLGTLGSA